MSDNSSVDATGAAAVIQLLTPEGERLEHPDYPLVITDDEFRALYRDLAMVRRFDNEATALQRQGELGLWASALGQEAAQVGSGRALAPADMAFPTYREHGVAWARGVPMEKVLELFRGVSFGGWDPHEFNIHLYTIVIGAQALHAVGYAMGMALDKFTDRRDAVVAYFGDGASSEGDVNEAFVFAASYQAPVVFFLQNNQWAISVPEARQSRTPLYQRAAGFGFPGVRIDGNDVLACLAVTRKALQHAREGHGPTLIEAFTYRMGAHTTSDDPTRYRLASELERWKLRDPIERVKAYLSRNGLADAAFYEAIDREAEEFAMRVRAICLSMPDPKPLDIFDQAYAGGSSLVDEERAWYENYLAGYDDVTDGEEQH
jgi:2-oxoisovalerate dehydrogenase E1 component alpha subunit